MLAQLRLVATRQRCFDPFVAWWSLCRTSQRDRRAAGNSNPNPNPNPNPTLTLALTPTRP